MIGREIEMNVQEWGHRYLGKGHVYRSSVENVKEAEEIVAGFQEAMEGKKVFLYGAGTVGKNYVRLFADLGIGIGGVFDRSADGSKISGYEVMDAECIRQMTDEESMVIVSANRKHFDEIKNGLLQRGMPERMILNGHDMHLVLQSAWCMIKGQRANGRIDTKDCWECTILDSQCTSLRKYLKRLNGYRDKTEGTTESVRMIGYILGNVCSLNCKNCCECIPYYRNEDRGFVPAKQVIHDIERLSGACDFLTILEFVGGEPFLHPELTAILEGVLAIKNVGMIHIFTNGTVLPNDEACRLASNERIEIYMSNYQAALTEPLLEKRKETINKLTTFGASITEGKKEDWLDYRSFERLNYTREESERNFADCFMHNCNRLHKGTLYTCPHQYAGINLGVMEPIDGVVDIHAHSAEKLAEELEAFRSLKTIDGCMHCRLPYRAEAALSGEQLER